LGFIWYVGATPDYGRRPPPPRGRMRGKAAYLLSSKDGTQREGIAEGDLGGKKTASTKQEREE